MPFRELETSTILTPSLVPPESDKSLFRKTGEFLGDITGIPGVVRGVGGAFDVLKGEPTDVKPEEFLGSVGKLGLTALTLGTGGVAAGIKGVAGIAARAAESGLIGAAFQALNNIEAGEPIKKGVVGAGALTAAIPAAGGALRGVKSLAKPLGEKIQFSLIKPLAVDIADGFKVENINKYGLGGSLQTTLKKTEQKLAELTEQLYRKIKDSDAVLDLKEIAQRTAKEVLGKKEKIFGDISRTKKVLESLISEVEEYSGNGLVSLPEAQAIKQAVGKKGAWVFGFRDPDSTAIETVYNKFYNLLKTEIENKAPVGVKEINKQISELIPISHAIIRRIPVAERQNVLGLGDLITGGFSIGSPVATSLFIANRLTKSGTFGKILAGIEPKQAVTTIGQRIFGK
jgi:hypothetical protein